jgi:hypothetical protein
VPIRLSVDLGTTHTVAVLGREGQRPRALVFDGSPLLPSCVSSQRLTRPIDRYCCVRSAELRRSLEWVRASAAGRGMCIGGLAAAWTGSSVLRRECLDEPRHTTGRTRH